MSFSIVAFFIVLCFSTLLAAVITGSRVDDCRSETSEYDLFENDTFNNLTCNFEIEKKLYPGEIPDYTFNIKCLPSCNCQSTNPTYDCVQLRGTMLVQTKNGTYYREYKSGCVCMFPRGNHHTKPKIAY